MIKVTLHECPSDHDWMEVKRRALVTIGKEAVRGPKYEWKKRILRARHSPIRRLLFSFYIECPYWVSTHLARHVHAQPYIQSQRNDRQDAYDRNAARQDEMVRMIWDMNADELIEISEKRLCLMAAEETREVVEKIVELVTDELPEFTKVLKPKCGKYGVCDEMKPCGNARKKDVF